MSLLTNQTAQRVTVIFFIQKSSISITLGQQVTLKAVFCDTIHQITDLRPPETPGF